MVRMTRRGALLSLVLPGLFAQAPGKGLVFVLVGPPGAGKSTQAAFLSRKYKIASIDIDHFKLKAGETVEAKVAEAVRSMDAAKGFILDGYPRTHAQADHLATLLKELKLPPPIIIQIDVPDEVARERVRRQFSGKMGNFEEQLVAYHKELDLLRQYYPQADIWTINGNRNSAQEVSETIVSLVSDRQ